MRLTLNAWWCICSQRNSPDLMRCCKCSRPRIERTAQVHERERAVVYYNPLTGEHKTPPRADVPMPPVYSEAGFERKEIMNMSQWEKESGTVHEASNFVSGSEPIPERYETPSLPVEAKQAVVKDIMDAIASGPWTGQDKLV